jgi:DNA polymerase I
LPDIWTIHPRYNQTVVESGRLSSEDPNAQNIPLKLRDLFVAPPGWYVWCADHSQLELRILARVSGCRAMIEAFQNGLDIHALTAQRVFGIPPQSLSPEMRVRSKTLNFGIAYEASPDAVMKQITKAALLMPELNLSVPTLKDCALLVREFFKAYPEVSVAVEFHHDKTRRLGYSETLYGRRRYLPNIIHPSQELRARAERQSWNLVVQGTAGDIMKAGELVVESYAGEYKADVRCQVHDELWGLVRQETGEEWLQVVARAMVLDQPLRPVPLKVDPKLGRTWRDAK